jgi:hypothetical protein
MSMTNRRARDRADIVLGEDWDRPAGTVESELRAARQRRSMFTLNRSPLARKIIMFNLLAIVILVAGVMYLNPFRDSLVHQRERALAVEAQLIADIFEASLPRSAPAEPLTGDGIDPVDVLTGWASPMGSTSSSSPIPTRSSPPHWMARGALRARCAASPRRRTNACSSRFPELGLVRACPTSSDRTRRSRSRARPKSGAVPGHGRR